MQLPDDRVARDELLVRSTPSLWRFIAPVRSRAIRVREIRSPVEAEHVWRQLSPDRTVFEHWSFRHAFFAAAKAEFRFVVAERGGPCALLPLQWNPQRGMLEFFGGEHMEDNRIFLRSTADNDCVDMLLRSVDGPVKLDGMPGDQSMPTGSAIEDYKYTLDLRRFAGVDGYLHDLFAPKSAKKIRKRCDALTAMGLTIEPGKPSDLEALFALNTRAFGTESWCTVPTFKATCRALARLETCAPQIFRFRIGNDTVGVSLAFCYKGTYLCFLSGKDLEKCDNLGTRIFLNNMEHAYRLGAHTLDACMGNYNWKEVMHLSKAPEYRCLRLLSGTAQNPALLPAPVAQAGALL